MVMSDHDVTTGHVVTTDVVTMEHSLTYLSAVHGVVMFS